MDRAGDWQVYPEHPTLGEGNTPVVRLEGLATEIGIRALSLKNEGANPTGSHKDRMSRFVVQRALEIGASTVARPQAAMQAFRWPPMRLMSGSPA
ncbi:pyridoxal-phosphate dependent enzyme [Mesorhizobium sp. M0060]|uniref:pyridoxal-phosphate dependent enzyme n=1 Tax=Mesorhizobium sp. M0060 TaxID=2956866 RepID=UPI00333C63CC